MLVISIWAPSTMQHIREICVRNRECVVATHLLVKLTKHATKPYQGSMWAQLTASRLLVHIRDYFVLRQLLREVLPLDKGISFGSTRRRILAVGSALDAQIERDIAS